MGGKRGEYAMDLTQKHCVPCEGGTPPLSDQEEEKMLKSIRQAQDKLVQHDNDQTGWLLVRDPSASSGQAVVHKLTRQFKFKNFKEAMAFVNKVAQLAESEQHHPDIKIVYNRVQLDLFTHAALGLSENDFIMAAKINKL